METQYLGRWILTPSGLVKGSLRVQDGLLAETCYGAPPSESTKAVVLPGLVNAHTHVADTIAYPAPKGTIEELVGPPDGYKHRILRGASPEDKRRAMRNAVETMFRTGTTSFADFREEGTAGIAMLRESLPPQSPRAVILGRPQSADMDDREMDQLLASSDGIGMSSVRDWPMDLLGRLSSKARAKGKMFAIHASESVREDIDLILGLSPNFVVHMTRAEEEDIRACVEHRVPIVVCPRSNAFYGITPDIPRMRRLGATVALGTDNGMISEPDMLQELRAAFDVGRRLGGITPLETVSLAVFDGRKVLNQMGKILTEASLGDDLAVIRVRGGDPLVELVTSAVSQDVEAVVKGGRVWRADNWRT